MLRLVGFGYATRYFLEAERDGQAVLVENPKFPWRFMPPALARAPQHIILPARKPPNTCRIFVFGESAAMGDPEPAHGPPRVLQVLLEDRFPDRKFEVVNVAITAVNSHAILPLARECAELDGDFWVLYLGNNEVMGPFGASTVFGPAAPHLTVLRAGLALRATRLGQGLAALAQRWRASGRAPQAWAGLEMFLDQQVPPDDPRLERVYRHFARNLADILHAGTRSGARVLVSTLVSNLKDCAPFGSLHAARLTADQRAQWDRLYQAGARAQAAGHLRDALELLQQAERLDDRHAELHFRLGRICLANDQFEQALKHFQQARDFDTLKFRADTRLNRIITEACAGREGEGVALLDAGAAFARQSPHGIVGEELLYEHVHFRFEGSYLLARLFAEQIARDLERASPSGPAAPNRPHSSTSNQAFETLAPPNPGPAARPWLTPAQCARRLAITDWSRHRLLSTMRQRLSRPPFTTQLNFQERDQALLRQIHELQPAAQRTAFEAQAQVYRAALAQRTDDWVLHDQFGRFLEAFGETDSAARQWRRVLELVPHHLLARYQLGYVLNRGDQAAEAERHLREAVRLRPDFPEALNELGLALSRQRKFAEARAAFAQALKLRPDFVAARVNWGLTLATEGKLAEAAVQYQAVLAGNSNHLPAHLHLARLLAQQGQTQQAAAHFREVLRLDPKNRLAREFFESR